MLFSLQKSTQFSRKTGTIPEARKTSARNPFHLACRIIWAANEGPPTHICARGRPYSPCSPIDRPWAPTFCEEYFIFVVLSATRRMCTPGRSTFCAVVATHPNFVCAAPFKHCGPKNHSGVAAGDSSVHQKFNRRKKEPKTPTLKDYRRSNSPLFW